MLELLNLQDDRLMSLHPYACALGDILPASGCLRLPVVAIELHSSVSASHDGLGHLTYLSLQGIRITLAFIGALSDSLHQMRTDQQDTHHGAYRPYHHLHPEGSIHHRHRYADERTDGKTSHVEVARRLLQNQANEHNDCPE